MKFLSATRDVLACCLFFLAYLLATQNGRKQMQVMSEDAIKAWDLKVEDRAEQRRLAEVMGKPDCPGQPHDITPKKPFRGIHPEPKLKKRTTKDDFGPKRG